MARRTLRRLVVVIGVCAVLAVAGTPSLWASGVISRSTGPTGYRGIVSANFNANTAAEEIVGDFGTKGIWIYHAGSWTQLTAANPTWMFAVKFGSTADYELIACFGSSGLWMWNYNGYPGTWTQLTGASASSAISVDDDQDTKEELQVDFGALGLWRYDWDTAAWSLLTNSDPSGSGLRTDLWTPGWEEGVWSFGSNGLWAVYWNTNAPAWFQLSTATPTADWASANIVDPSGTNPNDELVVEFSGLGTWQYDSDGSTWTQLTSTSAYAMLPARFGSNDDTELLFADSSYVLWWWSGSSWEQLAGATLETGFCETYDGQVEAFTEDEVLADYGSLGLWQYNYSEAAWTQLSATNPKFMVSSDYYGDGKRTSVVVDFGTGIGVWIWDSGGGSRTGSWHKITDSVPDSSMGW